MEEQKSPRRRKVTKKSETKTPTLTVKDMVEVQKELLSSDSEPSLEIKTLPQKNVPGWARVFAGVFVVFLFAIIVFGAGIYGFNWSGTWVANVIRIVPYPIAVVESAPILYSSYEQDLEAMRTYLKKQKEETGSDDLPVSEAEIKPLVLDRRIDNAVNEILLRKLKLTISQKDIEAEYEKLVDSSKKNGEEEVVQSIKAYYGWTPDEFQEKVIRPYVVSVKLAEYFETTDSLHADKKKKAEEVLEKVKKGTKSFEDLAKEYSDDSSAEKGGDLGYFGRGVMVREFEDAAYALEVGEVSSIVKTQFGYHIMKLEDRTTTPPENAVTVGSDDKEVIRARHILIKTQTFEEWLAVQKDDIRVYRLLSVDQFGK